MYTFQDFEQAADTAKFVNDAIVAYKRSDMYRTAVMADEYDAQRNTTITQTIRTLYNLAGRKVEDTTATNHQIASNLFNRLNTQRCMYSLGNAVSFVDPYEATDAKGKDETKEKLGKGFDHTIREAGYHALIHGRSYLFWDMDKAYEFKATEFVPLEDEYDGSLRAGIRFWQLERNKPLNAVLYEKDGYTKYSDGGGRFEETQAKRPYMVTYQYTDAGDVTEIGGDNYPQIPVVRMYGSRLKQSTLVGMREAIDSYDLILSGFANDLADCAQIYWIVENYGGMDDEDLREFLERIKLHHIAGADTSAGGGIRPYTQDIPYSARITYLESVRARIYEDFGGLDVHTISAGATNDHIDAGYQPLDENARDFEHWVGEAIEQLLALQGIEDTPVFTHQRISNQMEQVQMVVAEAQWLDHGTVLRKLPNITADEANAIMVAAEEEEAARMQLMASMGQAQGTGAPPVV